MHHSVACDLAPGNSGLKCVAIVKGRYSEYMTSTRIHVHSPHHPRSYLDSVEDETEEEINPQFLTLARRVPV